MSTNNKWVERIEQARTTLCNGLIASQRIRHFDAKSRPSIQSEPSCGAASSLHLMHDDDGGMHSDSPVERGLNFSIWLERWNCRMDESRSAMHRCIVSCRSSARKRTRSSKVSPTSHCGHARGFWLGWLSGRARRRSLLATGKQVYHYCGRFLLPATATWCHRCSRIRQPAPSCSFSSSWFCRPLKPTGRFGAGARTSSSCRT